MENDVIKFLLGKGSIDGVWFGEKHPAYEGNFWWRNHLRKYITQSQNSETNSKLQQKPITIKKSIPKLLLQFWDFIDKDCTANRSEYTEKEQIDLIHNFFSSLTTTPIEQKEITVRSLSEVLEDARKTKDFQTLVNLWNELASNKKSYPYNELVNAMEIIIDFVLKSDATPKEKDSFSKAIIN